ncbi:glycoside hydrolase [Aestuariivirga litoralis]|uniref:Glycoside hydrolase n=1 Tax=Aestuariivirga litoralis TaxID=2650924 RepID=A0A2W2AT27_9HYPH|nr:GH25 family lysozyme [Aestuariivirga litoralis]PZF76802.1 glycoside hydrolase [Aestuariivirga litoralis]
MQRDRNRIAVLALAAVVACFAGAAALAGGLSDRKPHDGVAAAHGMPVQGIDVSYFQGDINWKKVDAAGIRFAYIKATEGADRLDPKFHDNWRGARKAGIVRGAYHVMYWCSPARDQAAWFAAQVPADRGTLPPVLDVEWNGHSKTCPHQIARKEALAKMKVMLAAMEAHSGKRPIIYTDPKFHRDVLQGAFTDYQFWLRSTAAKPAAKYPGRDWSFWQFTTTGRVPGVTGPVDRNSYNGTPAQWARVVKRLQTEQAATDAVPETVSQ